MRNYANIFSKLTNSNILINFLNKRLLFCDFFGYNTTFWYKVASMQKSVQSPTAEGATFWKGLMWNFIWLFLNVSMTLLNKSIFVHLNFPYPITVSMIHMICTCIFSYLSIRIMDQPLKNLTFEQHKLVGKLCKIIN